MKCLSYPFDPEGRKLSREGGSGRGLVCSQCGNVIPPGSAFCNRCGSPLKNKTERIKAAFKAEHKQVTIFFSSLSDRTTTTNKIDQYDAFCALGRSHAPT